MVVYILRHEHRNLEKVDFFTPLNHIGKLNADTKVFEKFNDIEIDMIFSSPYRRTLQTVDKISQVKDIPIKLDWALCEKIGPVKAEGLTWPNYQEQNKVHEVFKIDKKYKIKYIKKWEATNTHSGKKTETLIKITETTYQSIKWQEPMSNPI